MRDYLCMYLCGGWCPSPHVGLLVGGAVVVVPCARKNTPYFNIGPLLGGGVGE